MQYYEKPQNYRLEEILISVEALSAIVDTVNEIRVIGGEPLMNPVCTDVVEKLIDDPKFRRVIIYTNGTICPPEGTLRRLRHPKVLFFITDYGTLSKNIDRLAQRLDNLKIQSFIRPAQGWTECSSIRLHRRSESDRNAIFGDCCAKHLATLMKGVLYRCPFSAHTTVLGAVPFSPEDFVHILDGERNDRDANLLKRAVREFFLSKRPLKACDFCEGRLYGAPEIEPAAQATHPLDYKRYFRILEERSHSLMSECGNG
jgi:hypothetical protein